MIAMVFLPWLAALIFSISSRGSESLRLRPPRILVVAAPSLPGPTAAMILPCWPPLLPPRWKFVSNHSIRRFWCSSVEERSEVQDENLIVSSKEEGRGRLWGRGSWRKPEVQKQHV